MSFCAQVLLPEVIRLPVPKGVSAALIHPELQVNTADARRKLAKGYSLEQWISQQGYLGGFIAACASGDIDMISKTLINNFNIVFDL